MIIIGDKIRDLREEAEISQNQLANIIGVKRNTVSQYETNKARPSYEVLVEIANYFKVSTDYLLGLESYPTRKKIN